MKYFLIVCIAFLSALTSSAQKDFEGVIKYKGTGPEGVEGDKEKSEQINITIHFAPGKLLMKNHKGENEDDEDVLVLIDSAKIYTINHTSKTYRVKKLRESKPIIPAAKEEIAGYIGTPIQFDGNFLSALFEGNTTLWYAEDLKFSIPKKYERNEELLMINNNHILLKAIIHTDLRLRYTDEDDAMVDEKFTKATLVATEVNPSPQPPSIFSIPNDYKKEDRFTYNPSWNDTTVMMMDTVAVMDSMPPPPPPKKDSHKKAPVKQPVKTAPAKKPIRKEN